MRLLVTKDIRTMPQLLEYKSKLEYELHSRDDSRQILRNKLRRCSDDQATENLKGKISSLGDEMKPFRKELKLCNDIIENSERLKHETDKDVELEREQLEQNKQNTKKKGLWKNEY